MENPRYSAVKLLMRMLSDGSYSNLLLDKTLAESEMTAADKRLCSMLFYGVTERLLTLRHIVSCYSKKPPEKLDADILCILYTGLYQLKYCEKIPERAAVNESVKLTAAFRKKSASGFVNAVLRQFLRDGKEIRMPEDRWQALEVQYSAPAELIQLIVKEHGEEAAERFLADSLKPPPCTVRLNTLRAEDLPGMTACEEVPGAYFADMPDVSHMPEFREGLFHVQDIASQLCCAILNPQPGETILDVCAAPGGKTFTIAERMENQGEVYAFDLHPKRVGLIHEGAERLGLTIVHADVQDAKQPRAEMPQADRILCDVPCSGLGVIRRKPEIKYKPLSDFAGLPEIQYAILEQAAKYLKSGGTLVYSTCTVSRAENEAVVQKFLAVHPEFRPEPLTELGITEGWTTFLPGRLNCDGFFAARLKKEG